VREQLKIETQYLTMFGVDLATRPGPVLDERQVMMMAEVRVMQQYRAQQGNLAPLAALPDNYATLPPADQAAADLERRRAQLQLIPCEVID
jgi:hypothetical protein